MLSYRYHILHYSLQPSVSDEYYFNYYKYYRRRMAPQVDVRIVIVVTISIVSVIQVSHFVIHVHRFAEQILLPVLLEKFFPKLCCSFC